MTEPVLEYHGNHLAINVKVYGIKDYTALEMRAKRLGIVFDDLFYDINDEVTKLFWETTATDLAKQFGFDGVISEGRSDGWCVPIYGGTPLERAYMDNVHDDESRDIRRNYFLFREEIRKIIQKMPEYLHAAIEDEINTRENEFLLKHSVAAQTLYFYKFGEQVNGRNLRTH